MSGIMAFRQCVRQCLLRPSVSTLTRQNVKSTMSTRAAAYEEMSNFWAKNRQLNRPLSPHVTVYKFHLTMAISIFNRVTAVAQQVLVSGVPILLVCLPNNFSHYFSKIKNAKLPQPFLLTCKFLIAFPFAFHLMAGLRHLVWDAGVGFGKVATIQGGVAILAGTLVLTFLLMAWKPKLEDSKA